MKNLVPLAFALSLVPTIAHAVPAADMRYGRTDQTNFFGLTTVPLFVVPSGQRFVLTDLTWTPGKYGASPTGTLPNGVGVWVQDGGSDVRWYQGLPAGSATPHVGFTTGIVFQQNEQVQIGVATSGAAITWSASWSGYVEPMGVSAVETPPDRLGFEVFPNPSGSKVLLQFRLERDGKAAIAIFDARGRKVRSLAEEVRASGWNVVEWDGRDDHGRAVREGTYFARLASPEGTRSEKMIRLNR
jgi:hypothetical protein